ncbi:ferritin-like domain-containing protein [Fibrella sp. HMF5335]|uniref:Ferritin-like domain-containing protein n=1 Tax=Fibrella rubiginis TaxID=2817060 RepID=A0A939GHF2_9BACT|nr:ferritin-like domain-containing protein [Fibrella rubiginis]MBO0937843.1 ferritin-like domain-containing protein [Fibrella rubiginis]
MNLFNIFSDIEKLDGDVAERVDYYTRRNLFKLGRKAATVAAAPAVLAASLNDAYAQTATVADVLNFALTLEYLEDEFYRTGLATASLIPAGDQAVIAQISKHEAAHVALLKGALGTAAVAKPAFRFGNAFSTYQIFLASANAFEDVGVRAYKGQAPSLLGQTVLTTALQIHSVEARHAAMIRRMRGLKGWISDPAEAPAAVYAGEDNTTQAGVVLTSLSNVTGIDAARSREAFDEILTKQAVLAIAANYL